MPWKSNPVMIFYNKKLMKKAGIDPTNPPLATYAEFLATSRKIVKSGAAPAAIYPAPTSEFFQSWFDFYPLYAASGGKQLVEDGKAPFDRPAGPAVANFWKTIYGEKLAPNEKYTGDSFADGKAAMAIVGPWAIAVYGDKVDWGVAPVPTSAGKPADQIHTFSDAKNVAMYTACKNRGTAWDVPQVLDQPGAGRRAAEARPGQMPMRTDLATPYADLLRQEPGLQDVRRPGRPHRRGAQRGQLDRDLAGLPRRLLQVGDLRQGAAPAGPEHGGGQGPGAGEGRLLT